MRRKRASSIENSFEQIIRKKLINQGVKKKMKAIGKKIMTLAAVVVLAASAAMAAPKDNAKAPLTGEQLSKKVRHELLMLPYYGVFDNLAYKIDGDTVTLYGQVVRPTTRSDAARSVTRIPGVAHVVNNIEVLPLSSFDDSIRLATYQQVFGSYSLYRYAMGANPSVHIVVNHGHVTLEGVVANKMDRQLAYVAASQVPGVFSVTNNLNVEGERRAY